MAARSEVSVAVKVDKAAVIRFARIMQKHFAALADDLEKLSEDEEAAAEPVIPPG